MRITLLELVGFSHVKLNQIQHLKYKPSEPYQLILGTNGSGKSSVMDQLTPWPANKDDFDDEGFKAIEIIHNGSKYRLTTEFHGKKAIYSFLKDSEELNNQSTISVQKVLVEKEFGINEDYHDLMMGRVKFTQLKPTERRVWFTRLSEVNYDYAIDVFKKLSTKLRDAQGSLRRAKSRLVAETEKVITAEEQERLETDLKVLEEEFVFWSNLHNPQYPVDGRFGREIDQGLGMLEQMSRRILKTDLFVKNYNEARSIEEVVQRIDKLRHEITAAEAELSIYVKEHDRVDRVVEALRMAGDEGVEVLQAKIVPLQMQRDEILRAQRLGLEFEDPGLAYSSLQTVRENLEATLLDIPANEERRFSNARLGELKEIHSMDMQSLAHAQNQYQRAVARREHADAHRNAGNTVCPKCSHVWVQGFSEKQYAENEEEIARLAEEVNTISKRCSEVGEEMTGIADYGRKWREYMQLVKTWPVLTPWWNHISSMVLSTPAAAARLIGQLEHDLQQQQRAAQLDTQIAEIRTMISNALVAGNADLNEALDEQATIEAEVQTITERINRLSTDLGDWQFFKARVMEVEELSTRVVGMIELLERASEAQLESEYQLVVRKMLESTTLLLTRKREAVNNAMIQRNTVDLITQQIQEEILDEEALALVVKELSPTEGLIAEGLLGFIRNFTGQMNHLIHRIWSYPLQVMPCGGADELGTELNYRFPLMVSSRTNLVPDVSKGSTGQKEMVDLAFKVVGMRYAGLDQFPLFLDEFAASFDETHRNSAMLAIKALMEQYPFTQLFMVSHYEGNHGTLTNAQVMVLCNLNITVPASYNQHVDIL